MTLSFGPNRCSIKLAKYLHSKVQRNRHPYYLSYIGTECLYLGGEKGLICAFGRDKDRGPPHAHGPNPHASPVLAHVDVTH
jgi:hypothetical protein